MLKPCPYCGKSAGFVRNVRAYGWCMDYYEEDGKHEGLEMDKLQYTDTKIRCAKCGRVRNDVEIAGSLYTGSAVIQVEKK